jgi:hypothetical protein
MGTLKREKPLILKSMQKLSEQFNDLKVMIQESLYENVNYEQTT